MTFKKYVTWCNDRICDGEWGMDNAIVCINIITIMYDIPWWKRHKAWKEIEENVTKIVNRIDRHREEIHKAYEEQAKKSVMNDN